MSKHHIIPPRLGGGRRTPEVRRWLLSNLGPYAGCIVDRTVLHFLTSYVDCAGAAALALYLRRFESAGVAASGTMTLISEEGDRIDVPIAVARLSKYVRDQTGMDDLDDPNELDGVEVDLPSVRAHVLRRVVEFGIHHVTVEAMTRIVPPASRPVREVVQPWYADYILGMHRRLLFELITASNFLKVEPLLNLTSYMIARCISGKTPRQMKDFMTPLGPEREMVYYGLFQLAVLLVRARRRANARIEARGSAAARDGGVEEDEDEEDVEDEEDGGDEDEEEDDDEDGEPPRGAILVD
mmetsp:Transcript_4762/g.10024  ORF Transcript_4762/g.10024 Transcript_4762/m.10024 type:complete len:297 (+) Transcript_4762:25-915(+)